MLAIFQFPISDTRLFDSDIDLRLPIPDWPNPNTDIKPQFVNYFGKAVERRLHADQAWPDEIKFCQASRALRFDNLAKQLIGQIGAYFRPKCAFRRLFCDGESVVRVEIGLVHDNEAPLLSQLKPYQVMAILIGLCDLPTFVPPVSTPPITKKLLGQGAALAKLYAKGTINRTSTKISRAIGLVEAGNPLLIVELKSYESCFPLIPDGFVSISEEKVFGANLAFGRVKSQSGIVDTWIIQRGKATKEQTRSLRLCILRLHAEQEALDITLKQIKRKRLIISSEQEIIDRFDNYFNNKTQLINRTKYAGINQSAVLTAFDASEQVTAPATRQNLINRYEGARLQVWRKVEDYQIRRATSRLVAITEINAGVLNVKHNEITGNSGIVNIAEVMIDVTNTVTNNLEKSSLTDEVKVLMKELTDQITAVSSQIDPKQAQRLGSDLQTLSSEMAQAEPRQAWYELSIKGLKDAAEAVGEIALPIVSTLQKIATLLI